MAACYHCGSPLGDGPLYRTSVCPSCGREAKVCLNCAFYAPGLPNDCREPQASRVVEKDRANFCDWFRPGEGDGGKANDKQDEARRRFDDLFSDG